MGRGAPSLIQAEYLPHGFANVSNDQQAESQFQLAGPEQNDQSGGVERPYDEVGGAENSARKRRRSERATNQLS